MRLYVRRNSPYWWVDVTLPDIGRRRWATLRPHLFPSNEEPSRLTKEQAAAKRDAEAAARAEIKKMLDAVQLGATVEMTLGEVLDRRLSAIRAQKSPDILRREDCRHRMLLQRLPASLRMSSLTQPQVTKLAADMLAAGYSRNSVNNQLALVSHARTLARKAGGRVVPDIEVPKEKVTGKLRYLTLAEEQRLLYELWPLRARPGLGHPSRRSSRRQRLAADQYDLCVFLLDTGCRYTEAATVPWTAVDTNTWQYIEIYRSKVDNAGLLRMTERLRTVLQRRWEERGNAYFVFPALDDGDRARGHATGGIMAAMKRAGINTPVIVQARGKATVHTLRDTFASRLAQAGMSLLMVGELLGHSDPHMTRKYAHLCRTSTADAAALILNRRKA